MPGCWPPPISTQLPWPWPTGPTLHTAHNCTMGNYNSLHHTLWTCFLAVADMRHVDGLMLMVMLVVQTCRLELPEKPHYCNFSNPSTVYLYSQGALLLHPVNKLASEAATSPPCIRLHERVSQLYTAARCGQGNTLSSMFVQHLPHFNSVTHSIHHSPFSAPTTPHPIPPSRQLPRLHIESYHLP